VGWNGNTGALAFNRQAIIDSYVTFAYVNAGKDPLVACAWKARVERVRDLADIRPAHMTQFEAIEALDDDTREHYFALLEKRLPEQAEKIRHSWERKDKTDGVTVYVSCREDDPTEIEFTVHDEIVELWADRDGSIDGSSWEAADEGIVYASTYWRKGIFEELEKEGYSFEYSNYAEPDDADLAASEHLHEFGRDYVSGGCCRDHSEALEHVETLAKEEAERHWQGFVDALAIISWLPLDTWQERLFPPAVLYPGMALAVAGRRALHAGVSP
jgi:hypothetical protein